MSGMRREPRKAASAADDRAGRPLRPSAGTPPPAIGVLVLGLAALAMLPGCGDGPPTAPATLRLDGLAFRAGVHVRESFPVQLGFRLVAENTTDGDVQLVTDGCGLGARAHRDPRRSGRPAWNGRPAGPCRASPAPTTVPAGDSVTWERDYSAGDVLGDSLPDGRYFFTASLGRASLAGSDEARRIDVAAGQALLAVPRPAGLRAPRRAVALRGLVAGPGGRRPGR